jgi:hypothetical protein
MSEQLLAQLLREYEQEKLTVNEVIDRLWGYACEDPSAGKAQLLGLLNHPDKILRGEAARLLRDVEAWENRTTDLTEIQTTSPLKPGAKVELSGGYWPEDAPWRQLGKNCIDGVSQGFRSAGAKRMPVAVIKLPSRITVTLPRQSPQHGIFCILKLPYATSTWDSREGNEAEPSNAIVEVYLVENVPDDMEVFFLQKPCAIELRATYRIVGP